jgi:hypothetical protein
MCNKICIGYFLWVYSLSFKVFEYDMSVVKLITSGSGSCSGYNSNIAISILMVIISTKAYVSEE